MGVLEILLIGVGLSMDAFAVTISNAMAMPRLTALERWAFPLVFGIFQALMPLIGYLAGSFFAGYIEQIAGIFTFIVLGALGANMAREGVKGLRHPEEVEPKSFSMGLVLLQAVATSIDALAVGVSFAGYVSLAVGPACGLIGVVTLGICLVGLEAGRRLGLAFGAKAQIAGGLILVIIGIRALLG